MIVVLLVLLAAAFCAFIGYRIRESRRQEAEQAAIRREKRRQRLQEEGADVEAEFNRLLEEKKKRRGDL